VNEEPITFSRGARVGVGRDGDPRGRRGCAPARAARPPRCSAGSRPFVDSVLVRKELEKLGQPVEEGEIDRAVESVRKANAMSEAQFAELLGKEGISLPAYRRRLRWQMERGAIVRARKFKESR